MNRTCLLLALASVSGVCHADYISIESSQLKQSFNFADRQLEMTATGARVAAGFDLNDHFSLGFSLGDWDDDSADRQISSSLALEDKEISLSYYLDHWSFTAFYAQQDDLVQVDNSRNDQPLTRQSSNSDSLGFDVAYDMELSPSWLLSLFASIQRNNWDSRTTITNRISPTAQILDVDSSATNANLGLSTSWLHQLGNNRYLTLGGSLSWQHVISGEQNLLGRSRAGNQRGFSSSLEDSYGLVSVFASWEFTESLSLDIGADTQLGSDETNPSSYIGLTYSF